MTRRSGLDACVFDVDGIRITEYKYWVNRLCPVIKANEKGQSYICAVAHQNIAAQAIRTKEPVIQECDAGLVKACAPIFVEDEFLGLAGGCGGILDDSEVESFLINKLTDIDEKTIINLSNDIPKVTTDELDTFLDYVRKEVDRIVSNIGNV